MPLHLWLSPDGGYKKAMGYTMMGTVPVNPQSSQYVPIYS